MDLQIFDRLTKSLNMSKKTRDILLWIILTVFAFFVFDVWRENKKASNKQQFIDAISPVFDSLSLISNRIILLERLPAKIDSIAKEQKNTNILLNQHVKIQEMQMIYIGKKLDINSDYFEQFNKVFDNLQNQLSIKKNEGLLIVQNMKYYGREN